MYHAFYNINLGITMKNILILVFILVSNMIANQVPYILTNSDILDERAIMKIKEIGDESKLKLGVNLYVDLKGNNGIDTKLPRKQRIKLMKEKENQLRKKVKAPYVILTMAIDQMYASILLSPDLKDIVDRDDVLGGYVIPLLASKDKNSLMAKASAASLNGYAQIADSIAAYKNIKLKSSIGNEGKIASTVWKVFMYTMVVFGIAAYIVIIMREKKYKNMSEEELKELEKNGK
jgi:ABC-type antimicrobial peptide transport system permease subunit